MNGQSRIIVNFKYDIVTKICEDLSESIDEYVYLMNSSGEIISHPYQLRYEEGVKPENNSELAGLSDGSYKKFFMDSLKGCYFQFRQDYGHDLFDSYRGRSVL